MYKGEVDTIKEIILSVIKPMGIELYELEYIPQGIRWILRIYIDKEGGVTLDDCTRVSSMVGSLLDEKDIIPHTYLLEVSSPGLDRPLKRPSDFRRLKGRLIKVNTKSPYHERTYFRGKLIYTDDERIIIQLNKESIEIPLSDIAIAKAEIEF